MGSNPNRKNRSTAKRSSTPKKRQRRCNVGSFESLEDRLVKRFMRELARGDFCPVDVPVTANELKPLLRLVGKPCRPAPLEVERNPRARSAVLRVGERTEHCHA